MFNNRRIISRPVNPAILEKNDINTLTKLSNKSLEQRVALRHENHIQSIKTKLDDLNKGLTELKGEKKEDPRVDTLKTQCELQSNLLKQYEEKLYAMVGYIKRLEQGLEKVKDLLTNNTNTADTIDKIPEFEEEVSSEVSEEVVEEVSSEVSEEVSSEVSEELTVEKVKEDGVVDESVSLEIVEKDN